MSQHLVQFGWFLGLLAIGLSSGVAVVWVRMNETVSRLRLDLGKCQDERGCLLGKIAALDDELDGLESECGKLRELVVVCGSCMLEIPRAMPFETVFNGKNAPMYKCAGCGRMEDRESLYLDFPELDVSN